MHKYSSTSWHVAVAHSFLVLLHTALHGYGTVNVTESLLIEFESFAILFSTKNISSKFSASCNGRIAPIESNLPQIKTVNSGHNKKYLWALESD